MRRIIAGLLACTAACGGDHPPLSGPDPVTLFQTNGEWQFRLTRGPFCSPSAAEATVYATLDFKRVSNPQSFGSPAHTVSSHWTDDKDVPNRFELDGSIRLASGWTVLDFWQSKWSSGFAITGSIRPDGTFSGRGFDPTLARKPVFSASGFCEYTVTGRRGW